MTDLFTYGPLKKMLQMKSWDNIAFTFPDDMQAHENSRNDSEKGIKISRKIKLALDSLTNRV
jgi:hypothetical protein